jgi:hypothetical protein
MLVVAAFALLVFWFRDYMSLRMSPSGKATRRALAYGVAVLVTALLLWAAAVNIGVGDFARRIQSPRILFLVVAFHVAASVPSIWIRRTQSYNWMWATAFMPAPIVWLLLLETSLLSGQGRGVLVPQFSFFGVAFLWAVSMFAVVFRTRDTEMPLDDLDFAVFFGALSHWLAMCALPLAISVI